MGFSFRKALEGALAQVNMFDGGKTYATVQRQAQQAPPAQTPQQGMAPEARAKIQNARYGVLANNPKRQRSFIASVSQPKEEQFNLVKEAGRSFVKEAVPNVALGIGRSVTGAAEGMSGLYDLATPGTGTNRLTKGLVNQGASIDKVVKDRGYSPIGYKIAQATTDIGSFLAPGAVAKGVGSAAKAGGVTGKVGKALSSTTPIMDKPIIKYASSPSSLVNAGVGTARSQGYVASREKDVNPGTIAMGAGASLLLGGAAGAFGAKAVDPLTKTKLVQNTNQAVSKAVSKPQVPDNLTQKRIDLMTARSNAEVRNKTGLIPTIDSQIDNVDRQISQATTRPILKPFTNEIGAVGKNVDPLESLKQETKPFVIPKTNPTDVTKLSNKDLEYYGKKGYTSITDKYGNTREIAPVKSDGVQRLDSLNPTGGLFVDYNPKTRATMPLADNMTTYDKTAGKAPDELVTIYRGAPKNQKGINAGDFITTNKELAQSYTGDGNVLEMKVPARHILDDTDSPLGEEYLYRPTQSQPPQSPLTVGKKPTLQDALEGKSTKIPNDNARPANQPQMQTPKSQASPKSLEQTLETAPKLQVEEADLATASKSLSSGDNTTNRLDKQAYKSTFGVDDATATRALSDLEKPPNLDRARGKLNKQQASLAEVMKKDKAVTDAAIKAQKTGKEFNFYGRTDKNGRSVGVEQFNPKIHHIEAGQVVDIDGKLLGNHIKIDETGTSVNLGGKYTNMDEVFGDISKWKSQNKYTSTFERNIMEAAPDEKSGRQVVEWIVGNKTKAERQWKEAISVSVQKNDDRYKAVMTEKPFGTSKKQVLSDAMDYGEANLTKAELRTKYGKDYAKTITDSIDGMRADYDRYITDINATRVRFGQEPIQPRKDYITHISELNNNKNFVGDLSTALKNSITGEAMERTRGGVPADISGRTENFAPASKWNQFLQRRTGGEYQKDPFKAFNEYVPNAEHNIHLTESISRARAAEEFLRARSNLGGLNEQNYGKLISDELGQKVTGGPQDDKLVSLFQEYANALAGKTQKLDRAILDSPLRPGLKGWQGLQRIGGRATILGNVSSVMMQPLNQVNVFASVKPTSYAKGMARWISGDDAIEQSNFVQARIKHIDSALRGRGQKFQDAAGVPLRAVEEQSVKLAWHANYEDVLAKGLKGKKAVLEADRLTERSVAGRGLADKPEAYRSTAINGLVQYTLEVMAQSKVVFKDLTPVQKAKWVAGAFALNTGYEIVMNNRPLPDYIDALVQGTGVTNPEDDRSPQEKILNTGQRVVGETVKFNPIVANAAQMLPKEAKTTLFGSDSNLTRYDGTAAPIRVLENAYKGGKAAVEGQAQEAISRGLRLVPTGNQVQKTLNSALMNARGYSVDKNGKPTFDAPTTPVDKARGLLFGPYATDAAQNYYNEGTGSLSQGGSTDKKTSSSQVSSSARKAIIESAFSTPEAKQFFSLSEDEQKAQASSSPDLYALMKQKDSMQKAFSNTMYDPSLSEEDRKILGRNDRLTNKARDTVIAREKDFEYKKELAFYNKAKAEGTLTAEEDAKKQKSLKKYEAGSTFDKKIRDLHNKSKTELTAYFATNEAGVDKNELAKKLVEYDDKITELGGQTKNKFRDKYGNVAITTKAKGGGRKGRRGGKGGKGSKGTKGQFNLNFVATQNATNKTLRQMVKNAQVKYKKA